MTTLGPYISFGVIGAPPSGPSSRASVTPDGALVIENPGFSDSLIPTVYGRTVPQDVARGPHR